MSGVVESTVVCPFCWQPVSMLFDLSAGEQTLVEDCQVCCNPMQITYRTAGEDLGEVDVEPAYG